MLEIAYLNKNKCKRLIYVNIHFQLKANIQFSIECCTKFALYGISSNIFLSPDIREVHLKKCLFALIDGR